MSRTTRRALHAAGFRLTTNAGALRDALATPPAAAAPQARQFSERLPQAQKLRVWFSRLDVPASISATLVSRMPVIYGLHRIVADRELTDALVLTGAEMTLAPSDVNGVGIPDDTPDGDAGVPASGGANTALAWGDLRGRSAAIIVGINLPMTVGVWRSAEIGVPGIQNSGVCRATSGRPDYLIVQHFPPGHFGDSTSPNIYPRWTFAPTIVRIPPGASLDVALVCRRSHVSVGGVNPRVICGHADIALTIGRLTPNAELLT